MTERHVRRESDVRGASSIPLRQGRVIHAVGGVYDVELDDGRIVPTRLRGRIKLEQRTGDRVVVGDLVEVANAEDDDATIENVAPRRTQLARRAPGRNARKAKVIVANVDHVVAVFAAARPEPRRRMLDRLLVLAESNELAARIVINKIDLAENRDAIEAEFADYSAAGYDVLFTSTTTGEGLQAFEQWICKRDSVVTGPSGVGKSSLLNTLEPDLALRVGAVSEAVQKGRHTTVSARLVPLACGGHVVDTPGLREVGMWGIDLDRLDHAFPEFRPLLGTCRFANSCTHTHEPDCAVQAAVNSGRISEARYQSYVDLVGEDSH